MMTEVVNAVLYGALFTSLFLIDYALGNGFVDMFQKLLCKLICFVKKSIREEAKQFYVQENSVSLSVLVSEVLFLGATILLLNKYKQFRGKDRIDELLQESREALRQTNEFLEKWRLRRLLNKYKQFRGKDRIDELLQESREALRQTNEFLEKWRLRRINTQTPIEHSYLDDEPQEIEPFKLEVPILHMAIVDTMGTTRSQPESGDAGDPINITDSTLLSVTSLLDDEMDSLTELRSEDRFEDSKIEFNGMEFGSRYLWDVAEEDISTLDGYDKNNF